MENTLPTAIKLKLRIIVFGLDYKNNAMRSSRIILLLISFFFAKFARAQSNELLIQGQTGKLYLEHTVVPKENWYSVGRLYNVSARELAPYNHTTLAKPLIIGEVLQIPLTATNFSQTGLKTAGETLIPVIHITQEKEWMYRISVNHNKVPIPSIEKWNHVTPDQVHPGMHLIVGYLRVKTALSALAGNPPAPEEAAAPARAAETPRAAEVTRTTETARSTETARATETGRSTETSKSAEAVAATTTKPVETVKSTESANPPVPDPSRANPPMTQATPPQAVMQTSLHFGGGAFKQDFNDAGRSVTGQAGVFKSTSGWQDGKYYALMNNAAVGTIVKITDPATGKSVYAKILGQLPEMKESAGLTIRLSNAAAAELGQPAEGRFGVQINY